MEILQKTLDKHISTTFKYRYGFWNSGPNYWNNFILYGAFRYCSNLTSITIPDSVTSIGNYAFQGCSKLAKVYYKGNNPYTSTITNIGSSNDCLVNATWYYFTENGDSESTQGNWWYYDTDGITIIEKVVE